MPDADELAFLRTIRESPDEDAPRLVFADWLDDHGQHARAEYIRVQCELDPMRYELDQPRVRQLRDRERELWYVEATDWQNPAVAAARETPCTDRAVYGPFYRRGVPELVAMSLDAFLAHGDAVLSAHPTIRELAVFDLRGRGAQLAASRAIERVDSLELADWINREDAAALMASPSVRSRRVLRVWDCSELYTVNVDHSDFVFAPWSVDTAIEVVQWTGPDIPPQDLQTFQRLAFPVTLHNPFAGPFLLRPDQGRRLHPGRSGDGRRALFGHERERKWLVFAVFGADGQFIESWERPDPGTCESDEEYLLWLTTEFGFRSEPLPMRPFLGAHRGLGVELFPRWIEENFAFFTGHHNREAEESSTGFIWKWLHDGHFVIHRSGYVRANRWTGEIIAT